MDEEVNWDENGEADGMNLEVAWYLTASREISGKNEVMFYRVIY